jgi:hypothetical protein
VFLSYDGEDIGDGEEQRLLLLDILGENGEDDEELEEELVGFN